LKQILNICVLVFGFSLLLKGQDFHFSQFYFTPVTLNPAQTGFFTAKFRLFANYREQWRFSQSTGGNSGYKTTYSAGGDMRLITGFPGQNDYIALGFYALGDKSTGGHLGKDAFYGSLAFHKNIIAGQQYLAFGFQGGINQWSYNKEELLFGDQIQRGQGSGTYPTTNETTILANTSYLDFNAGILWHYTPSKFINYYAGFAMHHLYMTGKSFSGSSVTLSIRNVFHTGAAIELTDLFHLLPAVSIMFQGGKSEYLIGTAGRINFDDGIGLRFGPWFRQTRESDALVFLLGLDYENLNFGLSYDINISSLNDNSKGAGGYELAVLYMFGVVAQVSKKRYSDFIPCPEL